MKAGRLTFNSDEYQIEAEYCPPNGEEIARCIVAHPHPQFGGSMDNNVVWALCEHLPKEGIGALRFNFRGVGNSTGDFDGGVGESRDIISSVELCKKDFDKKVFVAGYSFGAYAASLAAGGHTLPDAMALISPPIDMLDVDFEAVYKAMPCLVTCGDQDMFCSSRSLQVLLDESNRPLIVKGADHFWGGFENTLALGVAEFFRTLQ